MINKGEKISDIDRVERDLVGMLNKLGEIKSNKDVKRIIERLGQTAKLKGKKISPIQRPSTHHPGKDDVAEMYSPPRVTAMASTVGMKPGFAIDLTQVDEDGEPWDFTCAEKRKRAEAKIDAEEPSCW